MKATITRKVSIVRTARAMQMEGIFDVPPSPTSEESWEVDLPIEARPWKIGMIVGPSGCGKTTVARELFGSDMVAGYEWPHDKSVLDGFPADMPIKEITGCLSSVGFSSPPAWLRPFHVLSNGQQFRVTIARALADNKPLTVVDEFTSVVDRTVAQIGSHAIAKAVRKSDNQFIAVSCHYDIIDWLQPDWIFEPATLAFTWRSVQPRPKITMQIRRVHRSAWDIFKKHHYLSGDINSASHCYCGFIDGTPVMFFSVLSFPHPKRPGWRFHRAVCMPDFQGCGISTAFTDWIGALYRASGKPVFATTSNPALVHHLAKSRLWNMTKIPSLAHGNATGGRVGSFGGTMRMSSSFEYVGPPDSGGFNISFMPLESAS
jgi:hypothetical protein